MTITRSSLAWLFALSALLTVAGGCNKHSVPPGGECERIEDCARGSMACVATSSGRRVCANTCSIMPPGTSGAAGCPAGFSCERSGDTAYCMPNH